jgi:hypothetical protein
MQFRGLLNNEGEEAETTPSRDVPWKNMHGIGEHEDEELGSVWAKEWRFKVRVSAGVKVAVFSSVELISKEEREREAEPAAKRREIGASDTN